MLCLLSRGFKIELIITIPRKFKISYSSVKMVNFNYADLNYIARKNKIKIYEVDSSPGRRLFDYYRIIEREAADLILVAGWYYLLPKRIREAAKYGSWGLHASLLPNYAGSAPLNWAIINGEKETGVTLFKLDDGVDDGDIVAQKSFPIAPDDTIREVYQKATGIAKEIIVSSLLNINKIKFKSQDKRKIKVYPPRFPDDGEIDLTRPAIEIYNFIRAQSSPYPGAFIRTCDHKRIVIEKARIARDKLRGNRSVRGNS